LLCPVGCKSWQVETPAAAGIQGGAFAITTTAPAIVPVLTTTVPGSTSGSAVSRTHYGATITGSTARTVAHPPLLPAVLVAKASEKVKPPPSQNNKP
jgi:hypothetical protein